MAISAFKGPIVSFGSEPQIDNNEFEGPDVHNAGSALQDPRVYTAYQGGNWVVGWFQSGRGYVTVDATPSTLNATAIAATQSSATAMVLASANNSSSQVVVGATAINVNTGALVTGLVAIGCPDATATSPFLAFGSGGARGTSGVNVWDPTRAVARTITVTTAGTDTGRTVTIAGNDIYGVPMTQTLVTANTSAVSTTKAFKYIRSVTLDALPTGGVSIGVGTVFGLPLRADTLAYVQAFHLTSSAVAITAANTTASDATSGDARGTVIVAVNNTSRLTIFQSVAPSALVALSTGTNSGLLGLDQA
jgi:hypothetical protein